MADQFGGTPDVAPAGTDQFGGVPEGRDSFGGVADNSAAPSPDQKFQADPGIQSAADQYVKDKWRNYGRIAAASEGQSIRDYAKQTFGVSPDPSMIPAVDYRPEHDDLISTAYVRSTVPLAQQEKLEEQWRHEYLVNALGNAVDQQQQAANAPKQDVGLVRGHLDAVARGAADLVTQPVKAGADLFYALGDRTDNNGLQGANTNLTPNQLRQMATDQTLGQIQKTEESLFPKSNNAAQGGLAQYTEGAAGMLPALVIGARAFQAGGLQKTLALSQMGAQQFGSTYDGLYQAGRKNGQSDAEASHNALLGGLADAAVNTYLMKFGAIGQNAPSGMVRNILGGVVKSALAQGGVGLAQGSVSEVTKYITTGDDASLENVMHQALMNAAGGAAFGGVEALHGGEHAAPDQFGGVPDKSPVPAIDPAKLKLAMTGDTDGGRTAISSGADNSPDAAGGPAVQPNAVGPAEPAEVQAGKVANDAPAGVQAADTAGPDKPVPAEAVQTPLLDKTTAKYREHGEDGNSTARPLDFADPVDKALYAATQERQGKIGLEAQKYLESQGISPDEVQARGSTLRDRIASLAELAPDDETIHVPQHEDAENVRPDGATDPNARDGQPVVEAEGVRDVQRDKRTAVPEGATGSEADNGRSAADDLEAGGKRVDVGHDVEPGTPNAVGADEVRMSPSGKYAGVMERMRQEAEAKQSEAAERIKAKPENKKALDDLSTRVPTPEAPTTDAEALRTFKQIRKNFPDLQAHRPANREQAGVSRLVEQISGRRVVYVSKKGGGDLPFLGVASTNDPSTAFVRSDLSGSELRKTVWHEIWHTFQTQHPEMAREMLNIVPKGMVDEAGQYYIDRAGGPASPMGKLVSESPYVRETEAGATLFERFSENPNIMERLTGDQRSTLRKFVDWVRSKLGLNRSLTDVESKMRDYLDRVSEALRTGAEPEPQPVEHQVGFEDTDFSGDGYDEDGNRLRYSPLGADKFVKEDVVDRAKDAWEGLGRAWDGVKRIFAPQTRGPEAEKAAGVLREGGAELAQRLDRLAEALTPAKEAMDKLPVADTRGFIDAMEKGTPQPDKRLQPAADALRGLLDDRLKQVQGLGTGKLTKFIENYFPHLWKDPTKAAGVYADINSRRPWEGRKSFLKQRSLPLFSDGIAKGLEPVTENPVEATISRVREMDKYIVAQKAFQELRGQGLMKKVAARQVGDWTKKGYAKVEDNIATIYAPPNRKGGLSIAGYWMAPENVATIINNHLGPGLRSDPYFGKAFRGYLGVGNLMNQAQLGLSAFHATFVTFDAAVAKMAGGIEHLAKGRFKDAATDTAKAATLVGPAIGNYRNGGRLIQEWLNPGTHPDMTAFADALKAAGGRAGTDPFYQTGMAEAAAKAFRQGNVLGGLVRGPLALVDKLSQPILEHLVPQMKAGAFVDMMNRVYKPGMSRDELRQVAGKAWDSVENRLGEMTYDNLFWNRTAKDLAMASVRAVGWNLGTIRELGGGTLDTMKAIGRVATGNRPELTHRMAYTIALPLLTGLVGGIAYRAMTGQDPQELKDYYFPKTGEKDKSGHDVRLQMPGYMADAWKYAHDVHTAVTEERPTAALTTIGHKTHPMVNTILQMLSNQDYYGNKIRNEDDPLVKQLLDSAKHVGSQFVPFGVKDALTLNGEGQGAKSLLPLAGIVRARTDITHSDAELKAQQLMSESHPAGQRTTEQADHQKLVRDLADSLHRGEPDAADRIHTLASDGTLKPGDLQRIQQDQKLPGLLDRTVSRLDPEQAVKVWDVATPDERRRIGAVVLNKVRSSKTLDPQRKAELVRQLQTDWQALVAPQAGEGK